MARVQSVKQVTFEQNRTKKSGNRDGKKTVKQAAAKVKAASPIAAPKTKKARGDDDELKEVILALGGDDEDYELLKDVDSDVGEDPRPSSSKTDAALSKDVSKFMKDLNFSSIQPIEEDDEEDEANDSEEEAAEESSEDDENEDGDDEIEPVKPDVKASEGPLKKSGLLVEPTPQWYTILRQLPPLKKPAPSPDASTVSSLQTRAKSLHTAELALYEQSNSANKLTASSSDAAFLSRVLSSGTLSDRLSALTLLAQSSPVHNTRALETLKGMGQKKGREESLKALRAIVDWWVGGGAPDRKLKYFGDQPLTHPDVTDKHLVVWYFEDWMKKYFYSILQVLETLSLDPLTYVRMQTMSLILTLLKDKPEQEQNLLRLLVNKLGDSDKPVASRGSYHLLQLIQSHPSMKGVIVRELSSIVLRPSSSGSKGKKSGPSSKGKGKQVEELKRDLQHDHSKYYASITCNQIILSHTPTDREVAAQLINLYFELFKEILGQQKEEVKSAEVADDQVEPEDGEDGGADRSRLEKGKGKWKGKDKGKGKGKEDGFSEVEDGDSKLISAVLTGVNRALPFAKLGLENVEFTKHVDTLFLITHTSTFNISLQALRLILQICESFITSPSQVPSTSNVSTSIIDRYYRTLYTSLQDHRLASSSKQAMYLNLLLKSMKLDRNVDRTKAFVHRFVQLLVSGGSGTAEFIAGGLYLLGEIFKITPNLRAMLDGPSLSDKKRKPDEAEEYDPKKRDPQYAHAGSSALWELNPLLSHYHPTVQLHASRLLAGEELHADADLSLNTLSQFLDRFVYKNPKKVKPKGSSAMQPSAAPTDGTSVRVVKGAAGEGLVNDAAFWNKDVKNVPVDQVFFHRYFAQKNEKERAKADKIARRKGADGDAEDEAVEDEDDDEEEAEIWKAIKATHPDLQDNDESDPDAALGSSAIDSDDEADADSDSDLDHEASGSGTGAPDDEGGAGEDGDGLSMAEDSDAEDLIGLDDELPDGLVEYKSEEEEGEEGEWGGIDAGTKKRKNGTQDSKREKKRLRSLPTFASYDDYAKMIEDGPEDDI